MSTHTNFWLPLGMFVYVKGHLNAFDTFGIRQNLTTVKSQTLEPLAKTQTFRRNR